MKVKKFLFAFAMAVASFATCGLYAEIIVPDMGCYESQWGIPGIMLRVR